MLNYFCLNFTLGQLHLHHKCCWSSLSSGVIVSWFRTEGNDLSVVDHVVARDSLPKERMSQFPFRDVLRGMLELSLPVVRINWRCICCPLSIAHVQDNLVLIEHVVAEELRKRKKVRCQ